MTITPTPTQLAAAADPPGASSSRGGHVRLEGISMVYGSNAPAVDEVDLDILPGQFVTLLGASGSGKTTLLRIIAGFQSATAGRVVIDGRDVNRVPVHRRDIGMVFQNYALFPHMTVEKNVAFPLAMAKVPKKRRPALVQEALDQVHLSGFGHRKPSELSGGQQQRVALARAIVAKPRLLLMDEPLGALDRRLRENLQVEMRRLSRELGLTVINVTHDQEEALTMSDSIALLIDGKVAQFGSPEDLYRRPLNTAVAEFLGESNIFTGTVVSSDRGLVLETEGGQVVLGPCRAGGSVGAGDRASVVVRPDAADLWLSDHDLSTVAPDASWMPATVVATLFAGDSRKVVAQAPSGGEFIMRVSSAAPEVADGQRIIMAWRAGASTTVPQ